jgi:glycosyltransferase A (GT-A) superfamily protein (DUF2064 family)
MSARRSLVMIFTRLPEPGQSKTRHGQHLRAERTLSTYVRELTEACSSAAALGVMCRAQVTVGWDGSLFDCDFNRELGLAIAGDAPGSVFDFDLERLLTRDIRFAEHCFGCTAGAGSSCCGSTA